MKPFGSVNSVEKEGVSYIICMRINSQIQNRLSYIPLIAPSTSVHRMKQLTQAADSFIYVVSTLGVTGARSQVNQQLPDFLKLIRSQTSLPLAVGFGVSTREHLLDIGAQAEGVVIGSKIITALKAAGKGDGGKAVCEFSLQVTGRSREEIQSSLKLLDGQPDSYTACNGTDGAQSKHDFETRFGAFGGQYAPESLVDCLGEIERVCFSCTYIFQNYF